MAVKVLVIKVRSIKTPVMRMLMLMMITMKTCLNERGGGGSLAAEASFSASSLNDDDLIARLSRS